MSGLEELSREELVALVLALREQNEALVERVRQLERSRSRNSRNSSMPPSADDLPGREPPEPKQPKKRSGRSRGKQPGAKGSSLPWVEHPDEFVPHRPEGNCGGCGSDLTEAADVGVEVSHQVHDLPQVQIKVWQHDVYRVRCGCGAEHVGVLPDEVSAAPSSYGINLKALVVYLLVYQHVPVERVVRLIADLTGGTGPSTGFVHGMLSRCAAAVVEVVEAIKQLIILAYVVGFDETTLRAGPAGQKKYVVSASSLSATLYYLGGRDLGTFADLGVLPEFAGVAVHDRFVSYFSKRWDKLAGHQACVAHLQRDFTDAVQTYPNHHWHKQAKRALSGLVKAWHDAVAAGQNQISPQVRDGLVEEFRQARLVGLAQVPRIPGPAKKTKQLPGRELLEFCRDREDDVLRFCYDTRVWPTNNISERDLRPTKTQQKISGRLTSEEITQDRLDIRSYIDTARKHGLNVMAVLRQAISGKPWKPPIPAPT